MYPRTINPVSTIILGLVAAAFALTILLAIFGWAFAIVAWIIRVIRGERVQGRSRNDQDSAGIGF